MSVARTVRRLSGRAWHGADQYIEAILPEWRRLDGWGDDPGKVCTLFAQALLFAMAHPELARFWADHNDQIIRSVRTDLTPGEYEAQVREALDRLALALRVEGVTV